MKNGAIAMAIVIALALCISCCSDDAISPIDDNGEPEPDPCPDPENNTPPTIEAISDTVTSLGDTLRVVLHVDDDDGDALNIFIKILNLTITEIMKGLIPHVYIDTTSTEFVFIPAWHDTTSREFRITVKDPCGAQDCSAFTVSVTD